MPVLEEHASRHSISWEDFVVLSWELRARLAAIGVCDGAVLALALPNSPMTIALWLAAAANGAIVQAVDPDAGTLVLGGLLEETRPAAVVASSANARRVSEASEAGDRRGRLIVLDELEDLHASLAGGAFGRGRTTPEDATGEMVATLLATSGTSGPPKLVELTHHNLVMSAERLARNGGYRSDDRHYLASPFFHTNAQLYICPPPFATGGSIAVVPRFSAGAYFDVARATGATLSSMVAPPMRMALHRAIERGGADPGPLRLIQYGMTLSESDWKAWDSLFPAVQTLQIYGQTESVTGVLGGAPWEADDRRTIGRPFLGVEAVRLVGEDGSDVASGEPGELWVRGVPGVTLMRGYRSSPEATAETLVDGEWLRTGDVLVEREGGRLEFSGRQSHIIRRGGENLSTYALTVGLQSCPLVGDAAVTSFEDETLDSLVVAHLIPNSDFEEGAFLEWCRENLGKRGVPDQIRLHDDFPRTGSGRVVLRDL